jgi:hypothetical protein
MPIVPPVPSLPLAVMLLAAAVLLWRRGRRRALTRFVAALSLVVAVLLLGLGGYGYWFAHRPQPPPVRETLFPGVTYVRNVRQSPRPLVIHVIQIDLHTPGLSFLVTPGEPTQGHELRARTVGEFLDEFHLQVAINGDFFQPFRSNSLWDYYPHSGDPIDVAGLAGILADYGASTALNLDGGGSSALVVQGADGRPRVLNSPIDNYIPGRQRVVANQLGVYVAQP